jgi:hypothetical protein
MNQIEDLERFKLLVRNLREKNNVKLKIQTAANSVSFGKIRQSVYIQGRTESDNG